jgi:hypothetical protein
LLLAARTLLLFMYSILWLKKQMINHKKSHT